MLRVAAAAIALLGSALAPLSVAAEQTATEQQQIAERRVELLTALRASKSEAEASPLVRGLWRLWRTGPDIVATGLLLDVDAHLRAGDRDGALAILDQLVRDYPDWAEGWNARATVLFMAGRYDASLLDIEQVLALEPAHFGALSGRALIFIELGRYPEARAAIRDAMKINPWIPERHLLQTLPGERKT